MNLEFSEKIADMGIHGKKSRKEVKRQFTLHDVYSPCLYTSSGKTPNVMGDLAVFL
jgi:hypothetical protein